ncbi:hypothetical protein BC834DRAFT_840866 [Gloeopeniophorella convolvens]|nr:hypothetical protein BC834DRAFT_840866 [Gloeopeniophorella convolvens]
MSSPAPRKPIYGFSAQNCTRALRWAIGALGVAAFALECLGPEARAESQAAERLNPESPLLTANVFSDDLPELLPEDEAALLGARLRRAMKRYGSLWPALFASYGGPYAVAAGLKITVDCLSFLQPQLLRLFLAFISAYQASKLNEDTSKPAPSPVQGFAIASTMFCAAITQSIILHQYFQRCYETGMRVRAGLVTMIYQKALVLSSDERGRASGDIVNLMSVDANRLQDLCTYGLMALSAPVQITLAFVSLYNLLGWSAFVGVAIMIVSIPLNTMIARFLKNLQIQQMKNKDKRSRLMSELLANIRSIKLYAWENAFLRRVLFVRNEEELKMLRKIGIFTALNTTLWSGIPLLVAFSSFATAATIASRPLTSDIIFPAISLFMLLQFPLAMFAMITNQIIEGIVSAKRLQDFLRGSELQPDAREVTLNPDLCTGDVVLEIQDGEFAWSKDATSPTLEGINVVARKGELVGIVGRVGAGKSSLLSAIIGDMRRIEGKVSLSGTVAYAPQNPWLMGATIRENILFSHEYDEGFYNMVLDACALRPDLELLPNGDLTEVGEKGITRLLDDVLAAVDSQVARQVFDQVIGPRGLLATKARIVVTHSISFLAKFDQLHCVRRGIIVESGSYTKLAADSESHIYKLIHGHGQGGTSSGTATPFWTGDGTTPSGSSPARSTHADGTLTEDKINVLEEKLTHKKSFRRAELAPVAVRTTRAASGGLSEEQSAQGRVKPQVYWRYVEAASRVGFAFLSALQIAGTFALKYWSEGNRASGENNSALRYLWAYGVLALSATLLNGIASILILVLCSLRSSKHLHDSMLNSVIRAPLTFFELTPSGRILNLFTKDTNVVDQVLARTIQFMIRTLCSCIGIVVVIGSSFPPFLIAIIPLGWLYTRFMTYYLATSRELQRLNAVSRSPIISWFSESLNGLSTIRAFNQQAVFTEINERRVDRNQMSYLPSTSVNRWLAVRLEFIGATIIFISSNLAVFALVTSGVDAGLVGLVISYALNTTSSLNWLVRSASEVEQNVVSVERMLHYIELKPEAPYEVPETQPEGTWPSEGRVEFKDYSLRYRPELDLVLRSISLTLNPGEKIGVCGRTGAGKSSLLLALFRILEPAEGTILIDGVDITKIGLHDLRSAMTIVPQSPDLFEGTMRENIDPLGEYQDTDIWEALRQAHLKEYVEALPEGLDAPVREGGSSLSAGQRQLVCFARALLRKTKILVLDEATSAVDLETDKAIQEIIRGPQFEHTTILTIAHRLNTIMDSHRILVLDAGKEIALGSPKRKDFAPEPKQGATPSPHSHDIDSSSDTATGTDDEFDWDADEDFAPTPALSEVSKAKRVRYLWLLFMKLARPVRTLLVGILGVGIFITPFLVFEFRFKDSVARPHVHAWSLWFAIIWAASCLTYLVVDLLPRLLIGILVLFGYTVERLKTQLELIMAISPWIKLALDTSWAWIALSVIRAIDKPPGRYWVTINRVMQVRALHWSSASHPAHMACQALFSASVILLVEKTILHLIAINFHQKALAERLAENRLGLKALDRLSNAHPAPTPKRSPYSKKGHRSGFGSSLGASLDILHKSDHNETHDSVASSSSSPTHEKTDSKQIEQQPGYKASSAERKRRRKKAMASVIVDHVAQVALKDSRFNREQGLGDLVSARKLARKLFSALSDVYPPRAHLVVEDFHPYFRTTAEAHAAFALFDKDGNGDITKKEMREAVQRIYRERKSLTSSLKDVSSVVAKLDAVLLCVALVGIIFVCLLIFNRHNTLASLVPLATIILGFSFIFGHSAQTLFESLIFIFATHVFDVGDLVMIDDQPLFVKEFGLFSTTFKRVDGQEIIAPNALLSGSKLVHNMRRSNSMWESTTVTVGYDTSLEIIEQLKVKLQAYVAEKNRDWNAVGVNIDKMEFQNAIHLTIAMEHRPNWQDWGGRWVRRTAFMRYLKTVLEELDIRYTMPVQPVLLPRTPVPGSPSLSMRMPNSPTGSTRSRREDLGNAGSFQGSEFMLRAPPNSNLRPGVSSF